MSINIQNVESMLNTLSKKVERKQEESLFIQDRELMNKLLKIPDYSEEWKVKIDNANQVLENTFTFTDEWDMERCMIPVKFNSVHAIDWKYELNGDNEWTFMFNRHKFLLNLCQCYFFTADIQYLLKFKELLWDWLKKEPYADSKFWSTWRSIEMGIRLKNWIHILDILVNIPESIDLLGDEFLQEWFSSVEIHCEHLTSNKNLNMSYSSNWKIIEMNGLFLATIFFYDIPKFYERRKVAEQVLLESCELQIPSDGCQWEQSFMYHHEVLLCIGEVVSLCQRLGLTIDTRLKRIVNKMVIASVKLATSDSKQIPFGDSDFEDMRSILSWGALLTKNPNAKYLGKNWLSIDFLFLYGESAFKELESISAELPSFSSSELSDNGFFFLRDSYDEDGIYTFFKNGPHGGGHAHSDLLSLVIYKDGEMLMSDSGRYSYIEGHPKRIAYKSVMAHNSLIVDEEEFTVQDGSWGYQRVAQNLISKSKYSKNLDYVIGGHTGYIQESGALIFREIIFLKEGVWIVIDTSYVKENEKHNYTQFFNFPTNSLEELGNGNGYKYQGKCNSLYLQIIDPIDLKIESHHTSLNYNEETPSHRLVHQFDGEGSMKKFTIISLNEEIDIKNIEVQNLINQVIESPYIKAFGFTYKKTDYAIVYNFSENQPTPLRRVHYVNGVGITERIVCLSKKEQQWEKYVIKV